jgi:ribosomal protein L32
MLIDFRLSRQKRGKRLSGYDWPKKEKLMVDKSTFHNGTQTLYDHIWQIT